MRRRVVITGLGLLNACGNDAEAAWKSCVEGRSGIGPITRFDAKAMELPCLVAGEVKGFVAEAWVEPKEVKKLDLVALYGLAAAEMAWKDAGLEAKALDPERGLTAVGRRYLESVLCPTAVAWFRAVIQEAPHVPELRETFHAAEGGPVERALAGYLAELARRGSLVLDDPLLAAGQFLDLVRGRLHRRALAGHAETPTPAEIECQVAGAVRLFLHGCAPAAPGAAPPSPARRVRNPPGAMRVPKSVTRSRRSK